MGEEKKEESERIPSWYDPEKEIHDFNEQINVRNISKNKKKNKGWSDLNWCCCIMELTVAIIVLVGFLLLQLLGATV